MTVLTHDHLIKDEFKSPGSEKWKYFLKAYTLWLYILCVYSGTPNLMIFKNTHYHLNIYCDL